MEALKKFTDLMIRKIEESTGDWKKPWLSPNTMGMPQNLSGREYSRTNSLMLFLHGEQNNYTLPVYATFNQIKAEGATVFKGEKAFPVDYWNFSIKNKSGKSISMDDYKKLPEVLQADYKVTPFLRQYNVFNVEQTNLINIQPELVGGLIDKLKYTPQKDEKGMFSCKELDEMLSNQSWLCPIELKVGDRAYHTRGINEKIVIPLKAQFTDGESFYSTLLHEMAHSTGEEHHLNRIKSKFGRDDLYAREELIAEMTAALTGHSLGVGTTIREENIQYMKGWLRNLKEEPKFILSILSDVSKASDLIHSTLRSKEFSLSQNKNQEYLISGTAQLIHPDKSMNTQLQISF